MQVYVCVALCFAPKCACVCVCKTRSCRGAFVRWCGVDFQLRGPRDRLTDRRLTTRRTQWTEGDGTPNHDDCWPCPRAQPRPDPTTELTNWQTTVSVCVCAWPLKVNAQWGQRSMCAVNHVIAWLQMIAWLYNARIGTMNKYYFFICQHCV